MLLLDEIFELRDKSCFFFRSLMERYIYNLVKWRNGNLFYMSKQGYDSQFIHKYKKSLLLLLGTCKAREEYKDNAFDINLYREQRDAIKLLQNLVSFKHSSKKLALITKNKNK